MAVICPANQGCGGLRGMRIEDIRSSLAKCARRPDLEENGITFERCQSRVSDGRVRQRRHSPSACRRPIGYPAWRRAGAGRLSHSGILLPRRTIRRQHAVNRLGGDGHVAGSGYDGPRRRSAVFRGSPGGGACALRRATRPAPAISSTCARVETGGNVSIIAMEMTQTHQTLNTYYDSFGGGWGWGRRFGGWGDSVGESTTVPDTYRVGSLVVDLFDSSTKNLIWRGSMSDALSDKLNKNIKILIPSSGTKHDDHGCRTLPK